MTLPFCNQHWPWAALPIAWGGAFILSCRLLAGHDASAGRDTDAGAAGRMLSISRVALADVCYERADQYFHRGVPHQQTVAFSQSPFQKLHAQLAPNDHVHLHTRDMDEMMPWLELGMQFNPHNPDIYLTAAYWLSRQTDHTETALAILRKGQVNVPFHYEIQLEKGRLLLHSGRLAEAAEAFAAGLAFWPSDRNPDSRDVTMDRASLLQYRALLFEANGNLSGARDDYRAILAMFPHRHAIRARLDALRSDAHPEESARAMLEHLQHVHDRRMEAATCPRMAHAGHDHAHDDAQHHDHAHDHAHDHPHDHDRH